MKVSSLISKLFFLGILLISFSLRADVQEASSKYLIYTNEEIDSEKVGKAYEVAIKAWETLVRRDEPNFVVSHEGKRFDVQLRRSPHEKVSIKITDDQGLDYFHYFQDNATPSDHPFVYDGPAAENSPALNKQINQLFHLSQNASKDLTSQWSTESLKVMDEVHYLYSEQVRIWESIRSDYDQIDFEDFDKFVISHNKIFFHHELGEAEVNSVNKTPFIRVKHKKTGRIFLFVKTSEPNFDMERFLASPHMRQYISRQHIMSDSGKGRDVAVLSIDEFKSLQDPDLLLNSNRFSELKRFKTYSKNWWKEYFLAIKAFPTLSSFKFGVLSGILQAGVSFGTGYFINMIHPLQFDLIHTSMFVAAWGTGFGAIASMFRNWADIGSPRMQTIKNMSNGILFQYTLTSIMLSDLSMFNPLTIEGLFTHSAIFISSYLSNRGKPNWNKFYQIREKAGLNRGKLKFFGVQTEWSRVNVEKQWHFYMPQFVFRFMERTNFGFPRTTPVGMLSLIVNIPFSERIFLWYAEKLASKDNPHPDVINMAEMARKNWQKKVSLFTNIKIPVLLYKKYFGGNDLVKKKAAEELSESYRSVFKKREKKTIEAPLEKLEFVAPKKAPVESCLINLDNIIRL